MASVSFYSEGKVEAVYDLESNEGSAEMRAKLSEILKEGDGRLDAADMFGAQCYARDLLAAAKTGEPRTIAGSEWLIDYITNERRARANVTCNVLRRPTTKDPPWRVREETLRRSDHLDQLAIRRQGRECYRERLTMM